jgi:hypothetical protein
MLSQIYKKKKELREEIITGLRFLESFNLYVVLVTTLTSRARFIIKYLRRRCTTKLTHWKSFIVSFFTKNATYFLPSSGKNIKPTTALGALEKFCVFNKKTNEAVENVIYAYFKRKFTPDLN